MLDHVRNEALKSVIANKILNKKGLSLVAWSVLLKGPAHSKNSLYFYLPLKEIECNQSNSGPVGVILVQ